MAGHTLTLVRSAAPGQRTGASALLWARFLLQEHRRDDARSLLSTSLAGGALKKVRDRSTALLALAMLAQEDGDLNTAIGFLNRAETALVLSEKEWEFVRWDLLLAKSTALARAGRTAESAACARKALALFNDSGHSVAWHRLMLLDLELLSIADGDETGPYLLPKALGVLHLCDRLDVDRWLLMQVEIFRQLIKRGNVDVATEHASLALRALPADILGVDLWWSTLMKSMGHIGEAASDVNLCPVIEAFEVLEWEYIFGEEYEHHAPLLPRKRIMARR